MEISSFPLIFASPFETAQVAKLVDALSSGGSAARCAGSNPVLGTEAFTEMRRLFCFGENGSNPRRSIGAGHRSLHRNVEAFLFWRKWFESTPKHRRWAQEWAQSKPCRYTNLQGLLIKLLPAIPATRAIKKSCQMQL
jgi:hypothetical protein